MFIYLFWESIHRVGVGGRPRAGREGIPSKLQAVSEEANSGLSLTNREVMTWAEIKNQTFNLLSYPGAPGYLYFLVTVYHHTFSSFGFHLFMCVFVFRIMLLYLKENNILILTNLAGASPNPIEIVK